MQTRSFASIKPGLLLLVQPVSFFTRPEWSQNSQTQPLLRRACKLKQKQGLN